MSALETLADELRDYLAAHNLAHMSADELALELAAVLDAGETSAWVSPPDSAERENELRLALAWLRDFSERWERAESRQLCERHGHRDTGRGVCADCGDFLP